MRSARALDSLYGALEPPERARLMARCIRTSDYGTWRRIRASLPPGEAAAFNQLLSIARAMVSTLPLYVHNLHALAERNREGLLLAKYAIASQRVQHVALRHVWPLIPYPVTASEYAAIITMEHERPEPLDSFAWHILQMYSANQAADAGWRPDVVAWLRAESSDPDDDVPEEAYPSARALLDAAIARGELPAPTQTPEGPTLPWGTLMDWLEPGRAACPLFGPDFHVPCVELLCGLHAAWDVRPDSEQADVMARRDAIVAALSTVAGFHEEDLPSIHPPASIAERERQLATMDSVWPWKLDGWRNKLAYVGAREGEMRAYVAALTDALEESRRLDFAGEDHVPEDMRALLDALRETLADTEAQWADAGDLLDDDAWASIPEPAPGVLQSMRDNARAVFRRLDDE